MVLAGLSVMWYHRFRRIPISYFVSVDAGPDNLKLYVYSQSIAGLLCSSCSGTSSETLVCEAATPPPGFY